METMAMGALMCMLTHVGGQQQSAPYGTDSGWFWFEASVVLCSWQRKLKCDP